MTKFESKKPKEGKKYQVYFSGYEHPYVKSGYKVVRVVEKRKFAYLSFFNKNIKVPMTLWEEPMTLWEEMRKGAKEIEDE
jgi:hypothetical protein